MVKRKLVKPLLPARVGDGLIQIDVDRYRSSASESGLRLLWYIENIICWGEMTIIIKNGEPVRIVQALREVKLNNNGKERDS